jgi:hypothetical protein
VTRTQVDIDHATNMRIRRPAIVHEPAVLVLTRYVKAAPLARKYAQSHPIGSAGPEGDFVLQEQVFGTPLRRGREPWWRAERA